jgi:hypothetical protein
MCRQRIRERGFPSQTLEGKWRCEKDPNASRNLSVLAFELPLSIIQQDLPEISVSAFSESGNSEVEDPQSFAFCQGGVETLGRAGGRFRTFGAPFFSGL